MLPVLLRINKGGLLKKIDKGISAWRFSINHCTQTDNLTANDISENTNELSDSFRRVKISRHKLEHEVFDFLSDDNGKVDLSKFVQHLKFNGISLEDPRLKNTRVNFQNIVDEYSEKGNGRFFIPKKEFIDFIGHDIELIYRGFTGQFVIPEFSKFTEAICNLYYNVKEVNSGGRVADYIPQLSRLDPLHWGVSLCTIDGQRYSIGDTNEPFSLQSCSKPYSYALASTELGSEHVHEYISHEPSGEAFNFIKLTNNNKPHNPLINAGAIVVASLIKADMCLSDRFDFVFQEFRRLNGGEFISFNNAVCISEKETADRNFAIAYYLKENKCFPQGSDMHDALDLYFQMCSIEMNCESASILAATLANGGICPTTREAVLDANSVKNTLSMMYSCGMYDYSGEFAFNVGLPAKSGVAGAILLVVPNVMGLCLWSPPLDTFGNSVRGVEFSQKFVDKFNFHNYDSILNTPWKDDPRKIKSEAEIQTTMTLLFAAHNGDINLLKRLAIQGVDVSSSDYDQRTALHVAAAEGNYAFVKILLEKCGVNPIVYDRWGNTPLDEATRFNHSKIISLLETTIK